MDPYEHEPSKSAPEVEHLHPGVQRGWKKLKRVRHLTQLGSERQLRENRCVAVARTTGERCKKRALKRQDRCLNHGGKRPKYRHDRLMATSPAFAEKRKRQERLRELDRRFRREFDRDPFVGLQKAQLTDQQMQRFQTAFNKGWGRTGYRSQATRRAVYYLLIRWVREELTAIEVEDQWRGIDRKYSETAVDNDPAAIDPEPENSARHEDYEHKLMWRGRLQGVELTQKIRKYDSPTDQGW